MVLKTSLHIDTAGLHPGIVIFTAKGATEEESLKARPPLALRQGGLVGEQPALRNLLVSGHAVIDEAGHAA